MRAITKDEAMEWAAQIWCRPENSDREMDAEFAVSIANDLYEREIQIFDHDERGNAVAISANAST